MGTLTKDTYRSLSEGIRYVNLNVGQHTGEISLIPSVNPFHGTGVETIDAATLDSIEPALSEAHEFLTSDSPAKLASQLSIHEQQVRDAKAGAELALEAITTARTELQN